MILTQISLQETVMSIVSLAATALVGQMLYQIINYHFFHPLAKFPGPFWGGVTRLWIAYEFYMGSELETEKALHDKYGPVVRVTPTMLLVSDSTKLPDMYNRLADKSDYYITPSFGPVSNILVTRDHRAHTKLRKLIGGHYSFTNVKKLEYLVDGRAEHWLWTINEKFGKTGEDFNFTSWAVFMAYDVISEIGFGAPVGFIDAGCDSDGIIKNLHEGLFTKAFFNRLYPLLKVMAKTRIGQKYFESNPGDTSGVGILMRLRDKLLNQRIEDIRLGKSGDRVDLLQTFLDARTDDGKSLDIDYIKSEILLVLLAGADTTGTVMQGLMHQLLTRPEIYRRLTAEIDDVTRKGLLSKVPQYQEVTENCPYYVACVREVMRLWPSSPALFPRVVTAGGIDFGGKFAPPGTEVAANPWLVHRDKEMYGPDAEEYNPDRWMDPENAKRYLKYFFGFGYGARVCLGKDIALLEIYKGPLQFLRTFTPKLVDEKRSGTYTVVGGVAYWKDMFITITPRAAITLA